MSSAPSDASADPAGSGPHDSGSEPRLSLTHLGRRWARSVVVLWLLACVVLGGRLLGTNGPELTGDLYGLVPNEQRRTTEELLVLLMLDATALSSDEAGTETLLTAAAAIQERLGPRRIGLGPPAAEVTAWADSHALYLLPVTAHEPLKARLTDEAMAAAVQSLRARLSSPLFGVSGEQARRDPLGLHALALRHAGRPSHLGSDDSMRAELTPTGDLIALDGQALLMQVAGPTSGTHEELAALHGEIQAALTGLPVETTLLGPGPRRVLARTAIKREGRRLFTLVLSGLVIVLGLALRSIRPVLSVVLCIGTGVAALLAWGPPIDMNAVALIVLLAGFGCEGALHLQRISVRGWPAAAVLGTALLPLWLSPYPIWKAWSVKWLVGMSLVVLLLRLVLPAMMAIWGGEQAVDRRGFELRPMRWLAMGLAVAGMGAGAWAVERLPFRGMDHMPLSGSPAKAEQRLRESFFDPALVVEVVSHGRDPADALGRAALDARQLVALVPDEATRIDAPGSLVLPPNEVTARRIGLSAIELSDRVDALYELLEAQGFAPDAFGEFLRGATELETSPTPQAALDGPLGPWIRRDLQQDQAGTHLLTRVHLRADLERPPPVVLNADNEPLALRGPVIAARRDGEDFRDWLGIYIAGQLWLGALAVWLGTRSLPSAIGCACAALTAQTALLVVMIPLGLPLGPHVIPPILLVGAAAVVAGGRACRAVELGRRFYAMGVLLTGLCQAVAGLALLATGQPLWAQIGVMVTVGSVLASGAGLCVAPGLARLLRPRGGEPGGDR